MMGCCLLFVTKKRERRQEGKKERKEKKERERFHVFSHRIIREGEKRQTINYSQSRDAQQEGGASARGWGF